MPTIFTVTNEDLGRLGPQEAVDVFRELLWAEARRKGIEISKIHISSHINVPDGGIDALVEENIALAGSDLIKPGHSSYQIKSGTTFEPWQDAEIKKELFGKKYPSKENLGSGIRDCLDKNGTYVLVCFKNDLTPEHHRLAVQTLVYYLKQCGYQNPKVEVWSQNNLIGFLNIFPSLALRINGRGELRFQTHRSWSQDAEMKKEFNAGETQKDFISSMQNELRKNTEAIHIRVLGEPGIGKTRLVFEALRIDDLQPLVIYCDNATKFLGTDLMNEILRDDNPFNLILVIDECDPSAMFYIWDKFKYRGPRIKFVSIYNEYEGAGGNINYLNVPPLRDEQISSIIQGYDISKDQADRWVEFCSGYPGVAHIVGQNLKNNREDLLKNPDTVNIWERFIVGGDDSGSTEVRQRRLALRHIALFKRFGFGGPVAAEAREIAKIIEKADPLITLARFHEIIRVLRARRILQGENTLYITPKLLHIKLWVEWWDTYGEGISFEELIRNLPAALQHWAHEMLKYAKDSTVAQRFIKELLDEKGPFQT